MDAGKLNAIAAYRNQLKMMQEAQDTPAEQTAGTSSFANMVSTAFEGATDNIYKADAVQMQALTGQVDLSELVTAVTSAELALTTVVNVRDRIIAAYQDILRMPI